jgi:hypothetical protein
VNEITVTNICIKGSKISCDIHPKGEWARYVHKKQFWIEYDSDISGIPLGLAIVPLLGTLIPVAFIIDGTIICSEIDRDFLECILLITARVSHFATRVWAAVLVATEPPG